MYSKTSEIITASSIAASSCYSSWYLNGMLMEVGIMKHTVLPISTFVTIKLYRETTGVHDLIFKTHCPTSMTWFRPRLAITSSSTAGVATALAFTSNYATMEPALFADERILLKVGETSKAAYTKFRLYTRIDGIAKRGLD